MKICPIKKLPTKPYRMQKTDKQNDQVVIRKDTESENENDASSEPPAKKVNSTSAPSTSMPSRRKTSKERETNKITGGSGHHDSLVALDRLLISENILKRRISRFDLKGSMDVNREIDHINHRANLFSSDTTEAEIPSNEIGLKVLFEEMKELRGSRLHNH